MRYYKYKMNMLVLNVLAIILFLILILFYYCIFDFISFNLDILIYMFLFMILHEIIHGLAFMSFKSVKNKNIVFGAKLESGIFYCMCKQEISKKIILTSLLAPLIIIGIIPLIISIIFNLSLLGFLSIVNISGCIGDILMSIMFFKMPNDFIYTDLDDCESFVIISNEDLTKEKYLGLDLVEYGKYNIHIVSKDYKRLKISKITILILTIIFILLFLNKLY